MQSTWRTWRPKLNTRLHESGPHAESTHHFFAQVRQQHLRPGPFRARIKLIVKTGEYAGNEVKGYRAIGGVAPAAVAPFKPMGSVGAAPAAPAKSAPPWAKK